MNRMRVALVLPGLGRVQRGAEAAFLEIAHGLAAFPDIEVELFGTGRQGVGDLRTHVICCRNRNRFEGWPRLPAFRNDTQYEEFAFAWNLARSGEYHPEEFDAVIGCTYPHLNWFLRRHRTANGPVRIHVTQNGDWPCQRKNLEFRFFSCDGLVCTNPDYFERHRHTYPSALIPNGVNAEVYRPATATEPEWDGLDIPAGRPVVLMASAFIPSKRVADGVRAVAQVPEAVLVLAGDGPGRAEIAELAKQLLPGRHQMLGSVPSERMPALFRRADVFLHASQEEPFGIVYLEAAASGLTQVVHDGTVPHWILGDAALYANTSDAVAVGAALKQALAPETRRRLGPQARERVVREWTWDQQVKKYREFLWEMLEARGMTANARCFPETAACGN